MMNPVMLILSGLILSPGLPESGPASPVSGPPAAIAGSGTKQIITGKALQALEARYDGQEYRFSVESRWIPGSLLRINPEDIVSVDPEAVVERYTTFEVTYLIGSRHQTAYVQFAVDMERRLPVAGRRITTGDIIEPADLDFRWVPVPFNRGKWVSEAAALEGKTVRRTLAPGQPVRQADISTDFLVEAGDVVTLIYEGRGMRVELTGEARQNGAEDEEIRIYSNETGKRYMGRIVSPGVVKWQRTL